MEVILLHDQYAFLTAITRIVLILVFMEVILLLVLGMVISLYINQF